MIKITLLFYFFVVSLSFALTNKETDRIVFSIYKTEGGNKAHYLYGIRSVKYKDPQDAERICRNTIAHSYLNWIKSGKKGDFISFLGNRYCPVGVVNDPKGLNRNWVKNVKYFLDH